MKDSAPYRGDFEGIATRNGVSYGELVLEDRRRSVFHWEFLDPERIEAGRCPVPLTVRGTQALVSFAPLAFKLFCAARQNAVLRRSPFPSP